LPLALLFLPSLPHPPHPSHVFEPQILQYHHRLCPLPRPRHQHLPSRFRQRSSEVPFLSLHCPPPTVLPSPPCFAHLVDRPHALPRCPSLGPLLRPLLLNGRASAPLDGLAEKAAGAGRRSQVDTGWEHPSVWKNRRVWEGKLLGMRTRGLGRSCVRVRWSGGKERGRGRRGRGED
jgi:hypothetical protein